MKQVKHREAFGSRIGAVLVAAGSAIGLGSIWRFPYVAGENGGGGFILIYLLSVFVLGIPVMLAEFAIGTCTRRGAVEAYSMLSRRWTWLGYNSVAVSLLISGFYYIVAGWSLHYFISSVDGSLYSSSGDFHILFGQFRASWREPFYTVVFVLLTFAVVTMGVRKGLERTSKIMMPALLFMLAVLAVRSALMPGAAQGYSFLFSPDFSKTFTVSSIIAAIGQAFFSLSIGLGCMIAYSSYFKPGTNLTATSLAVSTMTLVVALLSGVVIFPAVFSVEGLQPSAGPPLIFETLPFVFETMPAPWLWSAVFFLLLAMAALTSTISFHEVLTQYLQERHDVPRLRAAVITSVASILAAMLCMHWPVLFDAFDAVSADILMPLGGLFTAIFAGWCLDRTVFRSQFAAGGEQRARFFPVLRFLLRYVSPLLLGTAFVYNLIFG